MKGGPGKNKQEHYAGPAGGDPMPSPKPPLAPFNRDGTRKLTLR